MEKHKKFDFFFQKSSKFEFDLCLRDEIIEVGLNMHHMTSRMHRRPFEGRHLVFSSYLPYFFKSLKLAMKKIIIGLTICSVTFILIRL